MILPWDDFCQDLGFIQVLNNANTGFFAAQTICHNV